MTTSGESADGIQIVAEDLSFLLREWSQDVDDASLRRSSPILRRLIVENLFQKAWRDVGFKKQPLIRSPSLESALTGFATRKIRFAQVGGATHGGMEVSMVIEYGAFMTPDQARKAYGSTPPERDRALSRFSDDACMIVDGDFISRRVVVKYIANKLGGVHLDRRRNPARREEAQFALLDKVREERQTAGRPAIYYEYLSIGQALTRSADVTRFLAAIKSPPHSSERS